MSDVIILMGSPNDRPVVEPCLTLLRELGVSANMHFGSAHRCPEHVRTIVSEGEANGAKVFICAAGGAAHLAGAVAAASGKPVIGIPLAAGALGGVDALYSTCNMPPGMPVATVSVGSWGATNAAVLAAQIIALINPTVAQKVSEYRARQTAAVIAKDQALQEEDADQG